MKTEETKLQKSLIMQPLEQVLMKMLQIMYEDWKLGLEAYNEKIIEFYSKQKEEDFELLEELTFDEWLIKIGVAKENKGIVSLDEARNSLSNNGNYRATDLNGNPKLKL